MGSETFLRGSEPIIRLSGVVGIETPDAVVHPAPGPMAASCLALLASTRLPIDPEQFVHQLWGDDAPASARASLRNHISRLNKFLGHHGSGPVVTQSGGYQLDRSRCGLDVELVEVALATARASDAPDRGQAIEQLMEVERFATDAVLVGTSAIHSIDQLTHRLSLLLTEVRELLIELRLGQGESTSLLRAIEAEVERQPYNERVTAHHMTALHRSGRVRDALEAFQAQRRRLVDDLGIEPSDELRSIEATLLVGPTAADGPALNGPADPTIEDAAEHCVGREHELASTIAELAHEGTRLVMVTGDAGMGKSLLVTEVLRSLPADVSTGVAWGDSDGESYHPWRAIARQWSTERACRPTAETFLRLSAAQTTSSSHPADLFDSALALVTAAAGAGRVVVAFDDAHRCDPASITLARRLHRSTNRLSLLLALRVDAAHNAPLDSLGPLARSIDLGPLPLESLMEMTAQRLVVNAGQTRRIGRLLLDRTGGHPLFVASLLGTWQHEPTLAPDTVEVPADLVGHLRRMAGECPAHTQRALEVASVLGPRFPADRLRRVLGEVDGVDVEAIEPAQRRGIIRSPERGQLAFSHELLRTTIYLDTPSLRRGRIHSVVARQLAEDGGADSTRAAWHACRSVPHTPPPEAVDLALAGADHAEHQHSFETAKALYAESLSVIDALGPDSFRPVALLGMARCMALDGQGAAAVSTLIEAERSVESNNSAELDDLLTRSARVFARYLRGDPAPTEVLARLVNRLPIDADTRVHASTEHLMAEFVMHGWTSEAERSACVVEASSERRFPVPHRLTRLFRRLGGPDAAETLGAAQDLLGCVCDDWWDQTVIERVGFQTEIGALLTLGRLDEALDRSRQMSNSSAARALPVLRWMASVVEADVALTVGEFDRSRLMLDELLVSGQEWEIPDAVPIHLGMLLSDAYLRRVPDDRLSALTHPSSTPAASLLVSGLAGLVHWINGRDDKAHHSLRMGLDLVAGSRRSNVHAGALMAVATLGCELGTDGADGATLYDALAPFSGLTPRFGQAGGHLGPTDRVLAVLSSRLGERGRARASLAAAIAQTTEMQAKPWIDRCQSMSL